MERKKKKKRIKIQIYKGEKEKKERLSPPANPAVTQPLFFIVPTERNVSVTNCFDLKLS